MRILVDATVLELTGSGVARATVGLYQGCRQVAPSLTATAVHRRPLSCPLPAGVDDLQGGDRLPVRAWRPLFLRWMARRLRPDIIHFPWNRGVIRPGAGIATVLTLHDVIPLVLPSLYFHSPRQEQQYRRPAARQVASADLVVTDSRASRQDIVHHLAPARDPVVVPLASSLPEAPPNVPRDAGRAGYFVYCGGYDIRKGLEELVRAYRRLYAGRQVSGPLWMVGEAQAVSAGFAAELAAGVGEGAVLDKGRLDDGQLTAALSGARALVYPSHCEGFGLPPLEAMGLGCPVITTSVSAMPEVCGNAALYFPPGDEAALQEAIARLERDEALRRELATRGRARARHFTWQQSATAFLEGLGRLRLGSAVADSRR